jgi:tetratricopeptide (TPR) repeat protein
MRLGSPLLMLTTVLSIAPIAAGLASGGGSMPSSSSMSASEPAQRSPEDIAKSAYNAGVHGIKDAKEYEDDAAKADKDDKKAKYLGKAQKAYAKALDHFKEAVDAQPEMYQAWNYIGFANRHLGHYDESLDAYAKALELKPDYAESIEYRGEAYLGLNQPDAAKQAYMTLFGTARPLADQLFAAMQQWLDARRADAKNVSGTDLDAFAKWLDERAQVAKQTASLAIGAASPAWSH